VILDEILKKIDGMKAQYRCWFDDGRYHCMVNTIIMSNEENRSDKLVQAFGQFANTELDAEEDAATALIERLKLAYRFEVDDINFIDRARNEHRREELEEEILVVKASRNREIELRKRLEKGWNMLLNEMENTQQGVEDMCGGALASLPADYVCGPHTDLIGSVCSLNDWLECKNFESTSDLMDVKNGL
jgi:hypothetical protein